MSEVEQWGRLTPEAIRRIEPRADGLLTVAGEIVGYWYQGAMCFPGFPILEQAMDLGRVVEVVNLDGSSRIPQYPRDWPETRMHRSLYESLLSEDEAAVTLEDELAEEVARQDAKHGLTFSGETELGRVRLGIACLQDEVQETLDAWRDERRDPSWPKTRMEALQVAAVAMRLVRQIDSEPERVR